MKRFNFLIIALTASMSLSVAQNYVNLSFTAKMQDNSFQALDSVKILNVTRGWEETIYYPDTVLQMINSVGIAEKGNNGFLLFQNTPNPFQGSTEVNVQLPKKDHISLALYDLSGKKYAVYNAILESGMHTFSLRVAVAQMYVLGVKTSEAEESIKLLVTRASDLFELSYLNSVSGVKTYKVQKASTNKEYQSNDSMRFTGYTTYNSLKQVRQIKILQAGSDASYTFDYAIGYAVGDVYYDANGLAEGVVCWIADTVFTGNGKPYSKRGKMISLNESDTGLMYGTINCPTYAVDSMDGRINTAKHMALLSDTSTYDFKERIEAAKWCTDHGEGWYFPAKCEMTTMLKNIDTLNINLQNLGATIVSRWVAGSDNGAYWTSTEVLGGIYGDHCDAYTISLYNNYLFYPIVPLYIGQYVRAMKWFGE